MGTAVDPALTWTLAIALAAIMAVSAAMKLTAMGEFAAALENYRLLPALLLTPVAWLIPALEAIAAAGLLIAATRAAACVLTAALVATFTTAVAINLARGRTEIDCGCFGPALRPTLSGWLIVRNAMLMAAAAAAAAAPRGRPLLLADFVTIGCGAATLVVLYASMNYLLANAPRLRRLERLHA